MMIGLQGRRFCMQKQPYRRFMQFDPSLFIMMRKLFSKVGNWFGKYFFFSKATLCIRGIDQLIILSKLTMQQLEALDPKFFSKKSTYLIYLLEYLLLETEFCSFAVIYIGLVLAHSFANHAVISILVVYLAYEIWETPNFQISAAIINVEQGVSNIMIVALAYFSYTCLGPFKVIVYTNALYIVVSTSIVRGFMICITSLFLTVI